MYRHLLAALDDTALAPTTVDHGIALARSVNARITFFYSAPGYPFTEEVVLNYTLNQDGLGLDSNADGPSFWRRNLKDNDLPVHPSCCEPLTC